MALRSHRRPPFAVEPGPGQESVWDYPRPPRVEAVPERVVVEHGGTRLADTNAALRVLETSQPPAYYLPPADVATALLRPNAARTVCEWKGVARYFDLVVGDTVVPSVAWSYPDPRPAYTALAGYLAFYAQLVDTCMVGDERVVPNPGSFYGGWITSRVVGPFKGGPGTQGW